MKDGSFRNAVKQEEEKISSWQTPPVIKETIIEASLDDEEGKYKVTTRVKKVKKVKKAPKVDLEKKKREEERRAREEAERLAREAAER